MVVFLIRTTEAFRTCWAAAGARNFGIEGIAGRGVWRRDSLAIEAKQRSIGAIMYGIESFGGPALDRDIEAAQKEVAPKV